QMNFFAHLRVLDQFTKVTRLTTARVVETNVNSVSSIRLYQRGTIVTNIVMIFVFGLLTGMKENTTAVSLGGLVVSLVLILVLYLQQTQKKHHNKLLQIRIIALHIWIRYGTAIIGRLILIYYQKFSIIWTGLTVYSKSKYEKREVGTMSIAIISLSIIELLGQLSAYLYAYELLTIKQHFFLLFFYTCGSTICVLLVYSINTRIMKELKRGARIDRYSINRTYQIRENLKVIETLIHFAGPTILFNIPCFLFYGTYAFLPQSLNAIRFFAAEFYDISTVL
ncbi:hypothetical protein PENTCL1PPCAC_16733, partial [Pristionchus entomophagus]